jgi:hypothetical protein
MRGDSVSRSDEPGCGASLPPGIGTARTTADVPRMSAALLVHVAPAGSRRLLADVNALAGKASLDKTPALDRLEAALGRELADRLVAALSDRRHGVAG